MKNEEKRMAGAWYLIVITDRAIQQGGTILQREKVLSHFLDVPAALEGCRPDEIWCCGPVPEEIVKLCCVRLRPQCGKLVECPVRIMKNEEERTDVMRESLWDALRLNQVQHDMMRAMFEEVQRLQKRVAELSAGKGG